MACSTCHVIVATEDFERLPPASEEEDDLLDLAAHVTRTSRLACQIALTGPRHADRADARRRLQPRPLSHLRECGAVAAICALGSRRRGCRQPGQVRKEAATTISSRVVRLPPHELPSAASQREVPANAGQPAATTREHVTPLLATDA